MKNKPIYEDLIRYTCPTGIKAGSKFSIYLFKIQHIIWNPGEHMF